MNNTNEIKIRLRTVFGIIIIIFLLLGIGALILYDKNSYVSINNTTNTAQENTTEQYNDFYLDNGIENEVEEEISLPNNKLNIGELESQKDIYSNDQKTVNNTSEVTDGDKEENNINEKEVIFEYITADRMAARGYAGVFKIYSISEENIEFSYNHGFNKDTSTIDRKIDGIAHLNINTDLYEFSEEIDNRQYLLTIDFAEGEDIITLNEYWDGVHFGTTNLFK